MSSILVHQVNTFGDNLTTNTEPSQKIWYPQIKDYFNRSKNIELKTPNLPNSGLPTGCTIIFFNVFNPCVFSTSCR